MIKFIKKLLGFKTECACPSTPKETVKEILTPPAPVASTYIEPAKPVNKIRAVGETGANAVAAATAPKPANKQRKPYRGNKAKSKQPITQGNTKGGNNAVKQQPKQTAKPQAPKPPKKK